MIELADVLEARDRVDETARRTPLDYSYTFSDMTGASVSLKFENLQRTGAFKIRGATNRIATLSDAEKEAGVVTASAGNHAQGVALAASRVGVDATIVMPEHAPISKVKATRSYGGEVILHGIDYNEAAERAHEIERQQGRTYVEAFDDPYVMAGQGTLGLEILEDIDDPADLDTVVVPIGGGGLISGVATAIKGRHPDVRVVGVQAEGASSAAPSLAKGRRVELDSVHTIADGIATRHVGELTFEVISERVDEVVTVSDPEIARALTFLLERSKTLVEGAGAVPLAALLSEAFEYENNERVVLPLCGGNIDLNTLRTVILRGLVQTGRYVKISTVLPDRPGVLEGLLSVIADHGVNIEAVHHNRTSQEMAVDAAEIELDLATKGQDHVEELLDSLDDHGYEVEVLV